MSGIAAIQGSPKAKDSASRMFIGQMEHILGVDIPVYQAVELLREDDARPALARMLEADALLIAFPLYIDSMPAPLIKLLTYLERAAKDAGSALPRVYAIVNCGFYEAVHNCLALEMVENFCARAGLPWGYGVGIGCGNVIAQFLQAQQQNSAAAAYAALCELGAAMRGLGGGQNVLVGPGFSRALYQREGQKGWRLLAKQSGSLRLLKARPHKTSPKDGGEQRREGAKTPRGKRLRKRR